MSYQNEIERLKPVLEKARQLDVATNPAPEAIFEAGKDNFQIWCTPEDHPEGWENVPMQGSYPKPCAYVASVLWGWEDGCITHLLLSTEAYFLDKRNRPADMRWAKQKIRHLFDLASVPLLPIRKFG